MLRAAPALLYTPPAQWSEAHFSELQLATPPAGNVVMALADRLQVHRPVLIGVYVLSVVCHGWMAATHASPLMLLLATAAESCGKQ